MITILPLSVLLPAAAVGVEGGGELGVEGGAKRADVTGSALLLARVVRVRPLRPAGLRVLVRAVDVTSAAAEDLCARRAQDGEAVRLLTASISADTGIQE